MDQFSRLAQSHGYSPQEVEEYNNRQRLAAMQRAQQQSMQQPAQQPSMWASDNPVGFATSLLPGGELIRKKFAGEDITAGDVALEAGLTAIPFGLGKIGKVGKALFKGGKAIAGAATGAKAASKIAGKVASKTDDAARLANTAARPGAAIQTKLESLLNTGKLDDAQRVITGIKDKPLRDGMQSTLDAIQGTGKRAMVDPKTKKIIKGGGEAATGFTEETIRQMAEGGSADLGQSGAAGLGGGIGRLFVKDAGKPGRLSSALMRQSTIAPTSTIGKASQQQTLTNLASRFPELRGSGFRKFQNVEKVIGKQVDEVDNLLKAGSNSIGQPEFMAKIQDIATSIPDGLDQKQFTRLYNRAVSDVFGSNVPPMLSATHVNALRRSINKHASTAMKKLDRGGSLTSGDNAILMLRDVLGDTVGDLAGPKVQGAVKTLNRNMNTLIDAIPEFKKLSEQSLKPFGLDIPVVSQAIPRMTQSALDVAGRTGAAVGRVTGAPAGQMLRNQALVRTPFAIGGAMNVPETPQEAFQSESPMQQQPGGADPLMARLAGGQSGTDFSSPQNAMQSSQAQQLHMASMLALQSGDIKSAQVLSAFADQAAQFEKSMGPAKMSTDQRKAETAATSALGVVDQIEKAYNEVGGAQGAITGTARNLGGKVRLDQDANYYNSQREGYLSRIARAFGEVGTLAEGDVQRAINLIPDLADTPENAQKKLAGLRQLIGEARQRALTGPSATFDDSEVPSSPELMFAQ